MPRTRIKICGITRTEDAQLVAELDADYVGFNFIGGPRKITISRAASILHVIHPPLIPVGLTPFALPWPLPDQLDDPRRLGISLFQVYTNRKAESPSYVSTCSVMDHWWAVRHIDSVASIRELAEEWSRWPEPKTAGCISEGGKKPIAFVLDTAVKGHLGGTGRTFNWHWIEEARQAGELQGLPPLILAGGLTPDNVADAIRIARPYAVDVSSGVELPNHPGIKDPARLRAFIQAVHAADAELGN